MMVSFLVCVYYNIIIAWCLYYLFLSMAKDVPWKSCGNWWNTENCLAGPIPAKPNCSALSNSTAAIANGTAAIANGTAVIANGTAVIANSTAAIANGTAALANTTVANCTSKAADYASPPLEYWE